MIDATDLADLIAAGNAQQAALNSLPHRCTYNVPYFDCKVERKVISVCGRCVAMDRWNEAVLKVAPAAAKAGE